MTSTLIDTDTILSGSEQWMKLEEEWKPIDLETEEENSISNFKDIFNTLDLKKSTFDSSFLFKRVRRKLGRQLSKASTPDYKEFLQDLQKNGLNDIPPKQFFFVNGQIISAYSVEAICNSIDNVFKSVEKLYSATSTIRDKNKKPELPTFPDVIQCSISTNDLSFDDTMDEEKEKNDHDDIDRYIDEVFEQLDATMNQLNDCDVPDICAKATVTTLVQKFSSALKSPVINCCPRRKRQCSDRFRDLAEFWKNKISSEQ